MGIIGKIREVWQRMFLRREAKDVFGVEVNQSAVMDTLIRTWGDVASGNPPWLDGDDDITTINFGQFIADVASGLVTLDIGVSLPDSSRGQHLQSMVDYLLTKLDGRVSQALCNAGLMLKPNGENIDYFAPGSFLPTAWDSNGNITGCMFAEKKHIGKYVYTKYEYHRFETLGEGRAYMISNRAFRSVSENGKGDPCELTAVPEWAGLAEDIAIQNVEAPLFAYFGNPKPNYFDAGSPLKTPIWANCLEELRDLDIAWSRKSTEVEDSKHMTFVPEQAIVYAQQHDVKLPRFMKGLQLGVGTVGDGKVDEHVATLLTEQRISDINATLAMISTKCGFDQGFFVMNEKTGVVTATQVEADDRRTIQTIKNIRDPLKEAILRVLYAANVFTDLYTDVPAEEWSRSYAALKEAVVFNFGDITYNYEEDKASWWKYRLQGDVPAWMYYTRFEGMSEDEAKEMIEQAAGNAPAFFEEE